MKKTILLLATVFAVGTSFAQYNNKQVGHDKDFGYNKGYDDKFDKGRSKIYFFTGKERDMQIAQIRSEYAKQIQQVKSKFFMSRMAKQRQVQQLEQCRDKAISQVWAKYNDRNNKGDDIGYNKGRGNGKW